MSDEKPVLCPSSRCEPGAILLGVVQADGRVGFLKQLMVVDQEFADIAREGRAPEKRFRFSSPCLKAACKQWTGSRCGVIDDVSECVGDDQRLDGLPECSIRPQCRWYRQNGAEACSVCPLVVTDLLVEEDGDPGEAPAAQLPLP